MKYTTMIPINDFTINDENREIYLEHAKESKADRLFLVTSRCFAREGNPETMAHLKSDIEYFSSKGFEIGVWCGETIGHGAPLALDMNSPEASFTRITGLNGQESAGAFCPLDDSFRASICAWIKNVAKTGTKFILLDDDFRMSTRDYGIGCACKKHIAKISELVGENVSREKLADCAFKGKTNKYRKAWLESQGYALKALAADIRRAVDEIDDNIRIGLCSTFPMWEVDGITSIELARILAGKNKPFLRLLVAPYWSIMSTFPMPNILETSVMYATFCKDTDIEIISEGDTYTRPRYNVPSSVLEQYDAYMRADGTYTGILKYMEDYTSNPSYDDGYILRHVHDLPDLERMSELFEKGSRVGVRIVEKLGKLAEAELPEDFNSSDLRLYPTSKGASMLARCSIPTTFGECGICSLAFGANASYLSEKDLENGLILDASAAKILSESGVDVGLCDIAGWKSRSVTRENFPKQNERIFVLRGNARFLEAKLSQSAEIDSYAEVDGERKPICYRYRNANGQRFLVYLFDTLEIVENSGLFSSFARQRQLIDGIEWLSGKKIPVVTVKNPDLVVLCKDDGKGLTIGLFNCHADSVLKPVLKVDGKYTNAEFLRCTGTLDDGVITLNELPSMGFAAIRVE